MHKAWESHTEIITLWFVLSTRTKPEVASHCIKEEMALQIESKVGGTHDDCTLAYTRGTVFMFKEVFLYYEQAS